MLLVYDKILIGFFLVPQFVNDDEKMSVYEAVYLELRCER